MSLLINLNDELKSAMRAKDSLKLEALRAIKSEVLLVQTSSGGGALLSKDDEIKLLHRLIKQRKDSAAIYKDQNRVDLASPEEDQAAVISTFLPDQLSSEQIEKIVANVILKIGAEGMKDMGKVMGIASNEIAGKADGKTISTIVKQKLSG
ncbi:MAG: GatB/YqeY domain-containing protein [Flavobacteriaceae bacterium TMED121]|nr:MAG: GatB/YqeY domain-containing protein [Flavobacteriaceae bacterium TMED121]|tara:strand:+ start:413 stop:865 length:453 start_codon:yes stop_codon:yes gene_type:complete